MTTISVRILGNQALNDNTFCWCLGEITNFKWQASLLEFAREKKITDVTDRHFYSWLVSYFC